MKRIILMLTIVCSLGLFAEQKNGIVYVITGGAGTGASWTDALGDIQAAITLAKSTSTARKDVWVGSGNYSIQVALVMADSVNVYGGFAGTETDLTQRAKVAGGKPWDFVNASVLTAGDTCRVVETSQNFDMETTFGGFTLTNGKGRGKQLNNSGGAAVVRGNMILLNCIVKNSVTSGNGGGVNMTGGTIRQCWIHGNTSQAGTTGGGAINANPATPTTATIEDCQLNANFAVLRGGAINMQGTGMTYCNNLKIFNNRALAAASVAKPGGAIYANSANNQIKNCLIYNNSGSSALYANGGSLYNNTIVKNVGGLYLAGNAATAINNIVWGCANDSTGAKATSITGDTTKVFTVQNNATYNALSTTVTWTKSDNILFSSNVSNGDVANPAAGTVGSGPKFNFVSRFFGVTHSDAEIAQLDSVDWNIPMASPCVNAGKAVTAVTADYAGLARPQGASFDIGAYELPYYTVIAGEPATANGAIYSSLGVLLAENTSNSYAKGSALELMFQPNTGHTLYKAYYTSSTDGGLTFTGAQTDFTSLIGADGFWITTVNSNFKVSVVWDKPNALQQLMTDKIKCLVSDQAVEIVGLTAGTKVSVYSVNGSLVNQGLATSDRMRIALSKGVYIVRVADSATKLIIN